MASHLPAHQSFSRVIRKRGFEIHVGGGHLSLQEVKRGEQSRIFFNQPGECNDVLASHHHARHPERGGIAEKDFGEALCRDRANTEAVQRLRRVLARASTSKIRSGKKNSCAQESRIVQRMRLIRAIRILALIVKRKLTKTVEGHAFHESRGDNPIGIDIFSRHIYHSTSYLRYLF